MHADEGKLPLFNGLNRVSARSARTMLRRASLAAVGGAVVLPVMFFECPIYAGNIDTLYSLGLTGAGVDVAQVEAEEGESTGTLFYFQDNPTYVNQPANFFEYIDPNGHISTSPGAVYTIGSTIYTDVISAHAENVGRWYFGDGLANWGSAAYGISHVDNYDAGWFQNDVLFEGSVSGQTFIPNPMAHSDAVVNQSFVNSSSTASEIQLVDSVYDYYTNYYTDKFSNTDGGDFGPIFVSAIGNGTQTSTTPASYINPPATMYNGIAVGLYGANVPGPTYDGRSKPDIVTPDNVAESSYAAPQVSAAAAILVQAGGLGPLSSGSYSGPVGFTVSNGGLAKAAYETDAMDERTVKALLLNGADKPLGWSHTHTQPLNLNYGSGILDVYNAYANLAGGFYQPSVQNSSTTPVSTSVINTLEGWNFNTLTKGGNTVSHYVFNPASGSGISNYNLTATLVWNAQVKSSVNSGNVSFTEALSNLYLELYDVTTGSRVDYSQSTLDNVQQIDTYGLNPGNVYDLQVYDENPANLTSASDPYSLAFNFKRVSSAAALYWNNASSNGIWDINTSPNFNDTTDGIISVDYSDADNVNFDDWHNPNGSYDVTLNTTVKPGSVTVNNNTSNYVISGTGNIAGATGITKNGTAGLTLSTANTYTGATTINAGTLSLGSSGSIADSATIDIAGGATFNVSAVSGYTLGSSAAQQLEGDGNVAGSVTVGASGTVSPGVLSSGYLGTLTVSGSVTFSSTSNFAAEVTQTSGGDQLSAGGNVTLAGTETISSPTPGSIGSGDTFTVIQGNVYGSFATVTLPTPYSGLSWNQPLNINNSITGAGNTYQQNYVYSVTSSTPGYISSLPASDTYAGFNANDNVGARGTKVTFLGGTVSTATSLSMQFSAAPGDATHLISDYATISGTNSDTYVLEISYTNAQLGGFEPTSPVLAVNNSGMLESAVLLNTGGTAHEIPGAYNPGSDFVLGDYGVDTTNDAVWAVLNYSAGDKFGVSSRLTGDTAGTGIVTPQDISTVLADQGDVTNLWSLGDFNDTDSVTPQDISQVFAAQGQTAIGTSEVTSEGLITLSLSKSLSDVPEPGSLAIFALGTIGLMRRTSRRSKKN